MRKQKIVDRNNRIVGYAVTEYDGSKKIYNNNHRLMGYYNPGSNATYDENHRLVAYGDQLLMLLVR